MNTNSPTRRIQHLNISSHVLLVYFHEAVIFHSDSQTKGYAVENVLLPFLLKSCSGGNPLSEQPGVQKMLDLMWVCMEVSNV